MANQTPITVSVANPASFGLPVAYAGQMGSTISFDQLVSAFDPDGDPITQYRIEDTTFFGGYLSYGGTSYANQMSALTVSASDLGSVVFTLGFTGISDTIRVSAFDGTGWGTAAVFQLISANGTNQVLPLPTNLAPVVSAGSATTVAPGAALFATDVFTVSDPDGDPITRYEIRDTAIGGGYWELNGAALADGTTHTVLAVDLPNLRYVGGAVDGTDTVEVRAFDGLAWSNNETITVTTERPNVAPVVAAGTPNPRVNGVYAASTFFSATDADGDPILQYEITDTSAGGGFWRLGGVAIAAGVPTTLTAAQLSQLEFVGAATPGTLDNLSVRAFDGRDWSAALPLAITTVANTGPQVTEQTTAVEVTASLSAAAAFSISDINNDAIVSIQFRDNTPDRGYWELNGTRINVYQTVTITPADLGNLVYFAGNTVAANQVQVRAFDGLNWGGWRAWNINTTPPAGNTGPVVTAPTADVPINTTVALAPLFSITDADGDAIQSIQIIDNTNNGGSVLLNGSPLDPYRNYTLTPADLANLQFAADSSTGVQDQIRIRAFDGYQWGAWQTLRINNAPPAGNAAPVIASLTGTIDSGTTLSAPSIFSVTDPDGDPITRIEVRDVTAGRGFWRLNGVDIPTHTVQSLTPGDLANLEYVAADVRTADNIQIRANDGYQWSAWQQFRIDTVTPPTNNAPVTTYGQATVNAGETIAIAALASVTDADGDTITQYQIRDSQAGGGYFTVNGVRVPDATTRTLTPAEFATVEYVGGTGASVGTVVVRGYDGYQWGTWTGFTITTVVPPGNQAPIVTAGTATVAANGTLAATSLFTATDGDGDPITTYEIRDNSAGGSFWRLGGTPIAAGTTVTVTAAQLATLQVVGGDGYFQDELQVRAFDGTDWGLFRDITLTTTAPTGNTAPVVSPAVTSVETGTVVAGATLFSATDAEGHPIVRYQVRDNTVGRGNWRFNGTDIDTYIVVTVNAADLGNLDYVAGSVINNNQIQVRADDGFGWGAWRAFNIATTAPVGNTGPVVTATATTTIAGLTDAAAGTFFTVTDPDGDAIVQYQIRDRNLDRGYFTLGGTELDAIVTHTLDAADFANLRFNAGPDRVANDISVRAFDGYQWGAWQNLRIDTVTPAGNNRPVVTGVGGLSVGTGNALDPASMFTASDADGHAIRQYQVRDDSVGGGYWTQNGAKIEDLVTRTVTAAQLGELAYVGGTNAGNDNLRVRAYDGFEWGNWTTISVSTFALPVVTGTTAGPNVLSDASGPTIYEYGLGDGPDTIIDLGNDGERDFLRIFDDPTHPLAGRIDSLSDDFRFTRTGNSLRIDLLLDGGLAAGSVTIQDMNRTDRMVETLRLFDVSGNQIGNDIDLTSVFAAAGTNTRIQETATNTLYGRTVAVV